jgi:GNAT superfamily N-acetyltransferase
MTSAAGPVPGLAIRAAVDTDVERLGRLIRESVLGLGSSDYSVAQLTSALEHLFGVDTSLIDDGTYFVVEEAGRREPVACGGWSRRRTLFGGDQYAGRSDDRLDPAREAARIRAFFVRPEAARRGIGSMLLEACERAARENGFLRMELMATLTGIPLYERARFRALERVELDLPDGVRFPLVRMERLLDAN